MFKPNPSTILKMTNVNKVFTTNVIETYALRDFNLEVKDSEFVSVTGPSGSGKTTFLNIAGLLENFDEGTYHLDGVDVSHLKDVELSRLRNEKIGFIFQSFNLIPELNLYDNVDVPLRYLGLSRKERDQRIKESLMLVGLDYRLKHYPYQLSGGQQQRVAIARALATKPKIILADEPTGNLNSEMAEDVLALLKEVNLSNVTIIMVTHDNKLAQMVDRNIHIKDGKVADSISTSNEALAALDV